MKHAILAFSLAVFAAGGASAWQGMPGMGGSDMKGMDHGHMSGPMLQSSDPAEGARLARAPRTLTLNFMHPVLLQTVSIVGPGNAPVAATFRRATAPRTSYGVALPALAKGAYAASWTASGMGHAMQGVVHFTVQ